MKSLRIQDSVRVYGFSEFSAGCSGAHLKSYFTGVNLECHFLGFKN